MVNALNTLLGGISSGNGDTSIPDYYKKLDLERKLLPLKKDSDQNIQSYWNDRFGSFRCFPNEYSRGVMDSKPYYSPPPPKKIELAFFRTGYGSRDAPYATGIFAVHRIVDGCFCLSKLYFRRSPINYSHGIPLRKKEKCLCTMVVYYGIQGYSDHS